MPGSSARVVSIFSAPGEARRGVGAASYLMAQAFPNPADSWIMKFTFSNKTRTATSAPADTFASVKAFLAASHAAGEPLEQSVVRARIQQDPLGALRERLATG